MGTCSLKFEKQPFFMHLMSTTPTRYVQTVDALKFAKPEHIWRLNTSINLTNEKWSRTVLIFSLLAISVSR